MSKRIIFVPQYPTPMRYQEWWFTEFPKEFEKAGFEVRILGKEKADEMIRGNLEEFSPFQNAINFECEQIKEYIDMDLISDDILFFADLSFPGFFGNALFHKRPSKIFSFCHATSRNEFDYFMRVRSSKFPTETAHAELCDGVFVGSRYHEIKLDWKNTIVTYLPYPPFDGESGDYKSFGIVSASRPTLQKVDEDVEHWVEKVFDCPIHRFNPKTWKQYYAFLSHAKILLITSKEDTFGYQIVDAVLNNCIPIAPNKLSYPEILPRKFLYRNLDELRDRIEMGLNGDLKVPKLLCDRDMKDFYGNIIKTIRGL